MTESDAEKSGATNIYVGVYGSDGTVDDQIVDGYHVDTSLFDHTDSYFLKSDNNTELLYWEKIQMQVFMD